MLTYGTAIMPQCHSLLRYSVYFSAYSHMSGERRTTQAGQPVSDMQAFFISQTGMSVCLGKQGVAEGAMKVAGVDAGVV